MAVRSQLVRILTSSDFETTERGRKFLAYVVEETLGRRADRIKAYSIATEVFGRDASFDSHSDPIVRIEAGHLRRALDRYYLTDGKADPIVITIPKGHYVPVFSERPDSVTLVVRRRCCRLAIFRRCGSRGCIAASACGFSPR